MEGYQFAHVEVYSVKGSPRRGDGNGAKKKNGDRAWTADEVIDEAERIEAASLHVKRGGESLEIIPGEVASVSALRAAHAQAACVKTPAKRRDKSGKTVNGKRKLRNDSASLYTCVVSLPVRTDDVLRDPEERENSMKILRASMQHEKERIEALGGQMMMGIVHRDEEFLHAHFYALDSIRARVDHLHAGRSAKNESVSKNRNRLGKSDANKVGNAAYCAAMRVWQDDFHEAVFHDAGLLRLGPRHERLSRSEYIMSKRSASERARDHERQKQIQTDRKQIMKAQKTVLEGSRELAEIRQEEGKVIATMKAGVSKKTQDADRLLAHAERSRQSAEELRIANEALARSLKDREKTAIQREQKADALIATIEGLVDGELVVENVVGSPTICRGQNADRKRANSLLRRISPAASSATRLGARIAKRLARLQERSRKSGLAAAREEITAARDAMSSTVGMALQVGAIARRFASMLSPKDGARMLAEIDGVLRRTASQKNQSEARSREIGLGSGGGSNDSREG